MEVDWNDKTIAITGATGLVGSVLVRQLYEYGCTAIRATKRSTSRLDLLGAAADKVNWVEGDLRDPYAVRELVDGADIVVHAAAMVSFAPKDRYKILEVNVDTTKAVVDASLAAGVGQLVFISSVAAIGRLESGRTITEESQWTKSKYNSQYAVSKHLSELEVWRAHIEGLPVTILNPSIILGAGYWQEGSAAVVGRVASGMPFYGVGATALVDVRDVVQAIVKSIDQQVTGERIIIAGHNVTYKDLFTQIADALSVNGPTRPLPTWLGRLVAVGESLRSRLMGIQPLVTPETVRTSRFTAMYDNAKSRELLNMNYTALGTTIADVADQYAAGEDYGVMPLS